MRGQAIRWLGIVLWIFTVGTAVPAAAADPAGPGPVPQRRHIQSPKLDPETVKREE
jgi:hypothetical protein